MENINETLPVQLSTDKLIEIVKTAPVILQDNKTRHDKALAYGQNLLKNAEQNGMNDDLDALMSDYQQKLRVTYKTINDARKPFTQIVDEVKKEFTSLEADIDPAGKANIFCQIQNLRNAWVTKKMEEKKRKEAEALRQQNIEKEKIEIEKQVIVAINEAFQNFISSSKRAMNNIFEGMTLETIDITRKSLIAAPVTLQKSLFDTFGNKVYNIVYISSETIKEIIAGIKTEDLLIQLNDTGSVELMEYRRELIEKIPSKEAELKAIAAANAEEAERLKREAAERLQLEEERIRKEQQEKERAAAQQAEVNAAGKTLEASVATQAELFTEAPKVKDSYEIIVKNPAGYGLIFQFWFEKEGRNLPSDKIEKKTVAQMKSFCEAYALKNDEKIKSALIEYKEIYKAK